MSKQEADNYHAAFWIGYFNNVDRLVKVEKSDHSITVNTRIFDYFQNGKIKIITIINSKGAASRKIYDENGKRISKDIN